MSPLDALGHPYPSAGAAVDGPPSAPVVVVEASRPVHDRMGRVLGREAITFTLSDPHTVRALAAELLAAADAMEAKS